MTDNSKIQKINNNTLDFTHETTKFLASFVPVVGYLHSIMVKSPMEHRLVKAVNDLAIELDELQKYHNLLTTEYLSNHPVFITAVSNIMLISIREHREEKLKALRNIALNTALPNSVDEDMQLMFIQMVDSFTTWHLQILRFFDNENWWEQLGLSSSDTQFDPKTVADELKILFPSLTDNRFLYKIINDLTDNQLMAYMRIDELDYIVTQGNENLDPHYLQKSILTSLGKQFVAFINSPLKNNIRY